RRGTIIDTWRRWARRLKTETYAVYLACRDPRTPWYARLVAGAVVAYAFSPIDLIPDPIPVLGYLDDLVIVPLGMVLALKLIPPQVLNESRARALVALRTGRPVNWIAAAVIVTLWVLSLVIVALLVVRRWVD